LLDPIGLGESTDGDSNDDEEESSANNTLSNEETSFDCNFTIIGGNVISGKSSIRSKSKNKKVKFIIYFLLVTLIHYQNYYV
jgi:hypothetical protein